MTPLWRDEEVVAQLRFAGMGRGLRQLLAIGEHVEQGGLAHIGTPNESDLRKRAFGAGRELGRGGDKGGLRELYEARALLPVMLENERRDRNEPALFSVWRG